MAQLETQGQLQEFLSVASKRLWQIVLPALVVLSLGTAFAVIVPKKYVVRTQLELRETQLDSVFDRRDERTTSSKEAGNAPYQLKSIARVGKVVWDLEWPDYLAMGRQDRYEYLRKLQQNIQVKVDSKAGTGSRFVTIEYMDPSQLRAEEFLQALRESWIKEVVERDRNALDARLQTEQVERDKIERLYLNEMRKLTELRSEHGISPTQVLPGQGQLLGAQDPIFERLRKNEVQLGEVRTELEERREQLVVVRRQLEDEDQYVAEDRLVSGQSYASELLEIEVDIQTQEQIQAKYKPAHSRWKVAQLEIDELKQRRDQLLKLESRSSVETEQVLNGVYVALRSREQTLAQEIQGLEAREKVLSGIVKADEEKSRELQEVYRELRSLETSVASYKEAFESASQQYFDTLAKHQVISGEQGNPFVITEEVVPPKKPSEPNPGLIIAFSLFAGLGLGIALAVLAEYSRSCFRSVSDISRVMVVPVLGAVNTIMTGAQVRRRATRRFAVAFSSFAVIGAVLFVTWAWAYDPDLLSPELREAIEALRSQFR